MFRIYFVQLGEPVCIVIIMRLFYVTTQNSVCIWQQIQSQMAFFILCVYFLVFSFSDSVNYKAFMIDEWI